MLNNDYFVGLDIGTDSIGVAVTDTSYNLLKHKGDAMWFVKLFDESSTAAERRTYRSAVRRNFRKRRRIELLQMLFNEPIAAVDRAFFQRLKESNLYQEDKSVCVPYAVFADDDYTDKAFHTAYPTIYHLRKELIENKASHDVRLVYLALHHLIKHRGHFLFNSLDASGVDSFDMVFSELCAFLKDEYDIEMYIDNADALSDVLKDRKLNMTQKFNKALDLCGVNKKTEPQKAAVLSLLCGKKESAESLFGEEVLIDDKPLKLQLSGDFDKNSADYIKILGDKYALIECLKAVYDWTILADVLSGERYVSFAKVESYNKHKADLAMLKKYIKTHIPHKYKEVFAVSKKGLNNYTAYCGKTKSNGHTGVLEEKCVQEEFCDYLGKLLKDLPRDSYETMFAEIESKTFMPKQNIKDNCVIPMQINRAELIAILDNAAQYLPFLSEADETGVTISQKIISIFDFRVPYYVGPLNTHSNKHWLVRKSGEIFPWNFEDIVDIDASAEQFINNLTSKCTYLPDKDVLEKNTVIYSKFTVLNELNNLRINGSKIDVNLKQRIFNDLFLRRKKVTRTALVKYLESNGYRNCEITGVDGDFKSNMKSYLDLCDYGLTESEMDRIITTITIFGDDVRLLKKRLSLEFSHKLTPDDIGKISRLKYSGWGRLSRDFLIDVYGVNKETGERINIIDALWQTNDNLMMLLSDENSFIDSVRAAVAVDTEQSVSDMVDSLYVSPKVKRPIIQSVRMLQEIVKVLGAPPNKIFVEMTRSDGEKGKRTASRKDKLIELYKSCKKDAGDLYQRLLDTDNEKLRSDKLYLYYTQFGRCMYSGELINLDSLYDNNIYDIDHIYPRSKVKDDSISNRVLVKKNLNLAKDNDYPISVDIRTKMFAHWKFLLDKELISKEKFKRLTRTEPLTDDELSGFISRQIVETSQSTKAVAQIFAQLYPQSDIVYVKAKNVSEFRHTFDMLKCREVNDLHHAKDAYLNIVVGNVYDELYTRNKANFIRGLQVKRYSLNHMFTFNVSKAWIADNSESIRTVRRIMNKNNIIYTRYSYCQHGSLFKLMPLKKGDHPQVPLTGSGPRSNMEKYGGYDKATATYFTLVRHTDSKGQECISMQPINLYQAGAFESNPVEFLSSVIGLTNPQIILKCVKYNTCISVDGFRMHISSKSGVALAHKPAMQLVLGYKYEKYIRNLSKYCSKFAYREINSTDNITAEENVELFDLLVYKMTQTILKVKFGDMGAKISAKRDVFVALSLERQVYVLLQILNILHANMMSGDLSDIGLAKDAGKLTTPIVFSKIKGEVKIINQSATGLFENSFTVK